MYPPLCGGKWKVQHTRPRHGAPLSPKWSRRCWTDSGVSTAAWGGVGSLNLSDPPTGRPYPPNGPGETGGTRVYPPLCGRNVEGRSPPTPPTGRPYPPEGPGRTGGTRVYLPLCGGVKGHTRMFPHGAPLSPKRPRQARRDSGVCAAVWGERGGRRRPQNGRGRTGGTPVFLPLCGERVESKTRMDPHGASLIPERPIQGRGDSGVSAAACGEKGTKSILNPPLGRPYPTDPPRQDRRDWGALVAVWGELHLQARVTPPPPGATLSPKAKVRLEEIGWYRRRVGESLEDHHIGPPTGVPIPQTAQAGPAGLGCLHRCVGRAPEVLTLCSHPPPFIGTSGLKHRQAIVLVHTPYAALISPWVSGGKWERTPGLGCASRMSPG